MQIDIQDSEKVVEVWLINTENMKSPGREEFSFLTSLSRP